MATPHEKLLAQYSLELKEAKSAAGDGYREAPPGDAVACLGATRLRYPRLATGLAYSPKGDIIAVSCGTQVLRWDAATGKMLASLQGHTG